MATQHFIGDYESFLAYTSTMDQMQAEGKLVNLLFYGRHLSTTGQSWCGDCVNAAPYIQTAFKEASSALHLVYVDVGDKPSWQNKKNPFREHGGLKLREIPTIIRWRQPQRLEGVHSIADADVLSMFFKN
jgi:thiol-disulfide isomerase/thioredoxin